VADGVPMARSAPANWGDQDGGRLSAAKSG
jgi:hypothetical protein